MVDTGFPTQDAKNDFSRARRSRVLSHLATRLRREPSDVDLILPFEEVIDALGYRGKRYLLTRTHDWDESVLERLKQRR